MTRNKWIVPVFSLLIALAFGAAVMAQEASDTDSFNVDVYNPYVEWLGGGFSPEALIVQAEPNMPRQYRVDRNFRVASLGPFSITVSASWADPGDIEVNTNYAILYGNGASQVDNVFDVLISDWGSLTKFSNGPVAGSITRIENRNTLNRHPNGAHGGDNDYMDFAAAVVLVLVDEEGAIDDGQGGSHDTYGVNPGFSKASHARFDALPAGNYTVDVTVIIGEES